MKQRQHVVVTHWIVLKFCQIYDLVFIYLWSESCKMRIGFLRDLCGLARFGYILTHLLTFQTTDAINEAVVMDLTS